ncbi:MAG: nucleoside hydrolase [Candidatus Limnocylindrales bacterium]
MLQHVILDTDTANEIDDQFALAFAALSPDRISLDAVYAAPFENQRATGPEDGMLKSCEEIHRVLGRLGLSQPPPVLAGSRSWMPSAGVPVPSRAAEDLAQRSRAAARAGLRLLVVAIGAPTNVASAILSDPAAAASLTVAWLGAAPTTWHTADDFNLRQDLHASRVLFNSGVDLVHVPTFNVTEHLRTTVPEIDAQVRPRGSIGAYLADIFHEAVSHQPGASRVLWDVGAVAWSIDPAWAPTVLVHSPILNDDLTWSHDPRRHLIREVLSVDRDAIFGDFFAKLSRHAPATA